MQGGTLEESRHASDKGSTREVWRHVKVSRRHERSNEAHESGKKAHERRKVVCVRCKEAHEGRGGA